MFFSYFRHGYFLLLSTVGMVRIASFVTGILTSEVIKRAFGLPGVKFISFLVCHPRRSLYTISVDVVSSTINTVHWGECPKCSIIHSI